jgi:hypothetical protein
MIHWYWTSIPKVVGSIPTVVRQTFQLARCGCTLRVTPQTSYSPEYITPTHTKSNKDVVLCIPSMLSSRLFKHFTMSLQDGSILRSIINLTNYKIGPEEKCGVPHSPPHFPAPRGYAPAASPVFRISHIKMPNCGGTTYFIALNVE